MVLPNTAQSAICGLRSMPHTPRCGPTGTCRSRPGRPGWSASESCGDRGTVASMAAEHFSDRHCLMPGDLVGGPGVVALVHVPVAEPGTREQHHRPCPSVVGLARRYRSICGEHALELHQQLTSGPSTRRASDELHPHAERAQKQQHPYVRVRQWMIAAPTAPRVMAGRTSVTPVVMIH